MSQSSSKKYEIDMCNGPLLGKILLFYIPLMLSGVLQLLFNAADVVVVGRYAGRTALAAVGSTTSLILLLVNLFIGLSVGTNVLVAKFYGAGKHKDLSEVVHTAIWTALVGGCVLIVAGVLLAEPALRLMDTPEDVIGQSVLYMRIYYLGMPFFLAYNFGSAILRAVGDTRRPLYYLFTAGVINVLLNLVFVIVFHLGVAGVAIATAISHGISSALVLRCLTLTDGVYKLHWKSLKIVPDKLAQMVRIGLPAGLQGSLFSISNMLIQSSVNSFGSTAMAGNTAASNMEGFVYTSMNALYQTSLSFTGQNFGAKKIKRIGKILLICQILVVLVGLVLGNAAYLFGGVLLRLYAPNDMEAVSFGLIRLGIISVSYFLCGMMDVAVGSLRGLGHSVMPMIMTLTGACLLRIVWVYTAFRINRTLQCLYYSYPISWILTFTAQLICFLLVYRRLRKKYPEEV